MSRLWAIMLVFVFAVMTSGSEHEKQDALKIGISPRPGYEPLVLGMENGLYEDLDVRIVRYATPSESFRALRDGIIDVGAFTADAALRYAEMHDKLTIFLILDISNGGDAIVARPEIKSLSDLKGKCVCSESSTLGHYVINRAMDFADGISIDDIDISSVEIGKHVQLYKSGEVDAVVTYEPFRSQLLAEGAHVVFDSTQIPQEIVNVLVTNTETVTVKSDALKKLVNGWYDTIAYINEHKEEAMVKMAYYEYISSKSFEAAYDDLIIPTRGEAMRMLGSGEGSFSGALHRLSEEMLEKGSLQSKVDTSTLLEPALLKATE